MNNITFVICFFVIPIFIGIIISRFIVLGHPDIKEFKVNMQMNCVVFIVILIGIFYVIWHDTRNVLDDWVTLGGFLGISTINLSLGLALSYRKKQLHNKK